MIYDLIYCGDDNIVYNYLREQILRLYPAATIQDASDFIHLCRFSVSIPDVTWEEWYMVALINGFFNLSFSWEFEALNNPKKALALMRLAIAHQKG